MTIKKSHTLAISFILLISSCSFFADRVENKLIGTWVLDSALSRKGVFYKTQLETKILIFKNQNKYSFEWMNGDVGNESQGNYYIHKNSTRNLNTIVFIPDLQIDGNDTVRQYMNYDIISLSDTSLKVVEGTQIIKRDTLASLVFNQQYIYKLKK